MPHAATDQVYVLWMDPFGTRIRLARKRLELNQEALGEKLSLTKQAIAAWEQGRNQPNAGQLARLCEALNVDANYLVLGESPAPAFSPEAMAIAAAFDAADDDEKKILRRVFGPAALDERVAKFYRPAPKHPNQDQKRRSG